MADNGSFKRPIVQALQQAASDDLVRCGQYGSAALQNALMALYATGSVAPRSGFVGDAFEVKGIVGSFDVALTGMSSMSWGLGFEFDAAGLLADESPYRVLFLDGDYTLATGGAPPAPGTYYVFVKWASADGQLEARLVRPMAGAAFVPDPVCPTAHEPAPDIVWSALPAIAGYTRIATVVVGVAPADSTAYTYTDERVSLTTVTRECSLPVHGARLYPWPSFTDGGVGETEPMGAVAKDGLIHCTIGSSGFAVIDIPRASGADIPKGAIAAFGFWVNAFDNTPGSGITASVYKQTGGGAPVLMGSGAVAALGAQTVAVTDTSTTGDAVFASIGFTGGSASAQQIANLTVSYTARYLGPGRA